LASWLNNYAERKYTETKLPKGRATKCPLFIKDDNSHGELYLATIDLKELGPLVRWKRWRGNLKGGIFVVGEYPNSAIKK